MERNRNMPPEGPTGPETGNPLPQGGDPQPDRPPIRTASTLDEVFDTDNPETRVQQALMQEALQRQAAQGGLRSGGGYDSEVLMGKKASEFEHDIPAYRQYPFGKFEVPDGATPDQRKEILDQKTEAQKMWVEGLMVKLETSPYSMSVMLQRPENQGIVVRLSELTEDASDYLAARLNVEKARQVRDIGGSAENFMQLGGLIGQADVMQYLLSRPGIARAYSLIEQRSNQADGPAFADPNQWGDINNELAKIIAEETVKANPYEINEADLILRHNAKIKAQNPEAEIKDLSAEDINQLRKNEEARVLIEEEGIQLRHVKQATALWRMHLRAALENGLVFKPFGEIKQQYPGMTEEQYALIQEELRYLPAEKRRENWDRYQKLVKWSSSIAKGSREDCIQRIIHGGFYLEQFQRGEATLRPGITFGSQDFLSNTLNKRFLVDSKSFVDGVAFNEVDKDGNPIKNKDKDGKEIYVPAQETSFTNEKGQISVFKKRVFIKFGSQGEIKERVVLHSNGVLEVDSKYGLDLAKVNWLSKGMDCYTGRYTAYNIRNPDKMRDNVSSPDKIAYDPSAKGIAELYGLVEHLTHIERAKGKFIQDARDRGKLMANGRVEVEGGTSISQEEWIQRRFAEERAEGVIYREDVYAMFIEGLLRYEKSEREAKTGAKNMNLDEADRTINFFWHHKMLTKEQAEQLKKEMLKSYTGYVSVSGSLNWLNGASKLVDKLQNKGVLPTGLAETIKSSMGRMSTLGEDAYARVLYNSIIIWQRDEPQSAILAMFVKMLQEGFSGIA